MRVLNEYYNHPYHQVNINLTNKMKYENDDGVIYMINEVTLKTVTLNQVNLSKNQPLNQERNIEFYNETFL